MRRPTASPAGSGRATSRAAGVARVGNRIVIVYLMLALIAVLPGLAIKSGVRLDDTLPGALLGEMAAALEDIRFGSGIRFWLGVTGAVMMALLLLYPLRKLVASGRSLGSVGGWFHMHMLMGLGGPVLVLYHCSFHLGGLNANVALWSMLAVAGSGIVGHFVYSSVSAEFYVGRQKAREQLDAIATALAGLDAMHPSRWQLIDELEAFEADLLTPRKGILASLAARFGVEKRRAHFFRSTAWHIAQCVEQLGLSQQEHDRLRRVIGQHLAAYVSIARHTSTRSVREQIWARWRLFHLPVFLVMVVAVFWHVLAVWGIDPPATDAAAGARSPQQQAAVASGAVASRPTTEAKAPRKPQGAAQADNAAPAASATAVAKSTRTTVVRRPPTDVAASASDQPARSGPSQPAVTVVQTRPVVGSAPVTAGSAPTAPVQGQSQSAGQSRGQADEVGAAKAEVKRWTDQPMSLGAPKPAGADGGDGASLTAQIAAFKAKRAAGQFVHSEAETGFALTGKHLKADCADCHNAPMRNSRQSEQRQCIDCHKKDDNHKGRRPDCAKCHTTNRWSQILRRG